MDRRIARLGAVLLAGGVLLFGAASLLHPPTASPWEPSRSVGGKRPVPCVARRPRRSAAFAMVALHLGLLPPCTHAYGGAGCALCPKPPTPLGVTSLTLWVPVFVLELTGWRAGGSPAKEWFGHSSAMPLPGWSVPAGRCPSWSIA